MTRLDGERIVYLDNAATSWPKPTCVGDAMVAFLAESGGNPGRSGHRLALAAGRAVYEARAAVAEALGVSDPLRVAFMHNATAGLNAALLSYLRPGDRVIAIDGAHNALARPLAALAARGVALEWAAALPDGRPDLNALERLVARPARLVAVTHGSNVSGALAPLPEIMNLADRARAPLLIDAAQTAGSFEIELDRLGKALVAFTGHKGMLGPGGTGGLAFGAALDLEAFTPAIRGGTGSASESEEQPPFMPDRFEAGTHNGPGLAGLAASLAWIAERGRAELRQREWALVARLMEGLQALPGLRLYGPEPGLDRCPVVSFSLKDMDAASVALALDEEAGVLCRVGLHCAPRAHRVLGSFPDGLLRWAPGPFTDDEDIDYAVDALRTIVADGRAGRAV